MNKDKVFLIIQGHTKHCDKVLENVKNLQNVIWSTDEDSPYNQIEKIKQSNVKLVLNPKINSGYGNVNFQTSTTISGLKLAKQLGATHAIKTRSDLIFSDPQKFISDFNFNDKIHHLSYIQHTPICINITVHYPDLPNWIKINYPNLINNICDYNYVTDFCNLGPIDEMIEFWSYPIENYLRIPAEFKLLLRYLKNKNYANVDLTYEWLSKTFGFFIQYLKETENPMISLKETKKWTTNDLLNSIDVIYK